MNLIKTLFLILIFGLLTKETLGQKVDYWFIRDTLITSICGEPTKESVSKDMIILENFDTTLLRKNIHYYYYDLGMKYYYQYAYTKDTNFLRKSIQTFEKALYHKPKYSLALWNLVLGYYILNNCAKSLYYLNHHKKVTPKRRWQKDQFSSIKKKCNN